MDKPVQDLLDITRVAVKQVLELSKQCDRVKLTQAEREAFEVLVETATRARTMFVDVGDYNDDDKSFI